MMKNIYQFGSYALGKPMPRFSLAHFIRKLMTAIFHEVIIGHSSFTRISSRFVKAGSLLFLMTMLVSHLAAQSSENLQEGINEEDKIQPLQVGDEIPEEVWELPLQMINHPEEKQVITLNEYRDKKVIILDFWATWCGSCLAKLPNLQRGVANYEEEIELIPVTYESKGDVEDFFNITKNVRLKRLWGNLTSIVDDEILKKHFPHNALPFIVVIRSGQVVDFPPSSLVDEDYLKSIINNSLRSKEKSKKDEFKNEFYSMLSGFIEQNTTSSLKIDSLQGVKKLKFINYPISRLYQLTGLFNEVFPISETVLVECSLEYDINYTEEANENLNPNYLDWYRRNLLTYELNAPISCSNMSLKHKMKEDLDFFLGVHSSVEKRVISAYVLKFEGDINKVKTKNKRSVLVVDGTRFDRLSKKRVKAPLSKNGRMNYVLRGKTDEIIRVVKKVKPNQPILDETGIGDWLDIEFSDDIDSFLELEKVLNQQGFALSLEKRPMDVLVLSNAKSY